MYESIHLWDAPVSEDLWWSSCVRQFKWLSPTEDPVYAINQRQSHENPAIMHAASCVAMSFDVPRYLHYLQGRLQSLGVLFCKTSLPAGNGLAKALTAAEEVVLARGRPAVDCFVNATGLGAASLTGDTSMYPIRGQTVLVKGEAHAIRTRYNFDGSLTYCIPRPGSGTTILGGTKEVGSRNAGVDDRTTAEILRRCGEIVPELQSASRAGFEVLGVQCGWRPGRKDGPRMEKQVTADGKVVVHSYGHAGAGYQNSVGCARHVLQLVDSVVGKAQLVSIGAKV